MASTNLSENQVSALKDTSTGSNRFAIDLYQILVMVEGNMFVSPLSVELVLALALTGAKGKTADEITKVIHAPHILEETVLGYSALIESLQSPMLKIAIHIFVEKTISLKPKFNKIAEMFFKSGATLVDFKTDCEAARKQINNWVQEKTDNKIQELLFQGILNDDERLVLVNALHFKANWKVKFNPELRMKRKFHVTPNKSVNIEMMTIKKQCSFRHSDKLKSKILKLEYAVNTCIENSFSMVFILPDKIDGLKELESKLSSIDISQELCAYKEPIVTVQIPKFIMEVTVDLTDALKELGAVSMFSDEDADFRELSNSPRLVVSKVIQKAFVEVSEEGTEAASATAAVIRVAKSLQVEPEPEEFIADHPFMFVVCCDSSSFLPVLIGRFSLPSVMNMES